MLGFEDSGSQSLSQLQNQAAEVKDRLLLFRITSELIAIVVDWRPSQITGASLEA